MPVEGIDAWTIHKPFPAKGLAHPTQPRKITRLFADAAFVCVPFPAQLDMDAWCVRNQNKEPIMSLDATRECLKNMSNSELVQVQNAVVRATDLSPDEQIVAMHLLSEEVCTRSVEGIGRKAERFMNRHGQTVAAVAVGAVLGVLGCDVGHDRIS